MISGDKSGAVPAFSLYLCDDSIPLYRTTALSLPYILDPANGASCDKCYSIGKLKLPCKKVKCKTSETMCGRTTFELRMLFNRKISGWINECKTSLACVTSAGRCEGVSGILEATSLARFTPLNCKLTCSNFPSTTPQITTAIKTGFPSSTSYLPTELLSSTKIRASSNKITSPISESTDEIVICKKCHSIMEFNEACETVRCSSTETMCGRISFNIVLRPNETVSGWINECKTKKLCATPESDACQSVERVLKNTNLASFLPVDCMLTCSMPLIPPTPPASFSSFHKSSHQGSTSYTHVSTRSSIATQDHTWKSESTAWPSKADDGIMCEQCHSIATFNTACKNVMCKSEDFMCSRTTFSVVMPLNKKVEGWMSKCTKTELCTKPKANVCDNVGRLLETNNLSHFAPFDCEITCTIPFTPFTSFVTSNRSANLPRSLLPSKHSTIKTNSPTAVSITFPSSSLASTSLRNHTVTSDSTLKPSNTSSPYYFTADSTNQKTTNVKSTGARFYWFEEYFVTYNILWCIIIVFVFEDL